MSSSLFTKPSLPVASSRQLPQHPKMRLSYILNPAPPTAEDVVEQPVVPELVPLLGETVSRVPSSSHFQDTTNAPSISGLIKAPASYNSPPKSPTLGDHELLPRNQPRSHSRSPCLLPSRNLMPSPDACVLDQSLVSLRYPSSDHPNNHQDYYHNPRTAFCNHLSMNQGVTGLPILPDRSATCDPTVCLSPAHTRDPHSLPTGPIHNPQRLDILHTTSSSLTVISRPLPRHPKMDLSYILNPSPEINQSEEPNSEVVDPNPVPTFHSPSPTSSSESEVSSPSASSFHSTGSPVPAQRPGLDSPSYHESPVSSPATTPPPSPPPVPHDVPDLPQMVQPPQHLPWEEPPPVGLNPQNHRAYQRAGVHWMLAQIFGPDI